jgi:hypothetical protein
MDGDMDLAYATVAIFVGAFSAGLLAFVCFSTPREPRTSSAPQPPPTKTAPPPKVYVAVEMPFGGVAVASPSQTLNPEP